MTDLRLPSGWVRCRVDEAGRVHLGRQRSPDRHSGPNMRPYLRVANVFEDRIDTTDVMSMDFSPEEFERYRLHPGDILLNEGQSLELIGRPAIYEGKPPDACFTNSLIRFQPVAGVLSKYACLLFRYYMHSGKFAAVGSITTNIAHLSAGRFAQMDFLLAPTSEQRRIVEAVETLFSRLDAVEVLLARVVARSRSGIITSTSRTGALRQAILRLTFEGRLVKQDSSDEPASILLERVRRERAATAVGAGPARRGRRSRS